MGLGLLYDDRTLLKRIKAGDNAAMRELYRRYVRYLSAICSRYISDDEDVKDVLQDAFVKIFSSIGTFEYRGSGSLKAWMARITLNQALKFLNKNRLSGVPLDDEFHNLPDEDEEPDSKKVPSKALFQMIRDLPEGYRTVFNLYVVEGRSHKEIAGMLGISEATSASQLHRAKAALADKIRSYTNE